MTAAAWMLALALTAASPAAAVSTSAEASKPDATAASERSFLDEPSMAQPTPPRSVAQAVGMALVVGMMAVGGCVAYGWAHSRRGPKVAGAEINLLAYKTLGGRQRLALVEVCGERLLLSANEREVTLLSHLPGAQELPEVALEHVDEVSAVAAPVLAAGVESRPTRRPAAPAPQTVAALEEALAQREAAPQGTTDALASGYSADLAGLHRWQAHAQQAGRA